MNGIINKRDPIIPLPPPSSRLSVLWLFHGGQFVRNMWSFFYLITTNGFHTKVAEPEDFLLSERMHVCLPIWYHLSEATMDAQMYKASLCNQRPLSSLFHINEAKWVEEWDAMRKKPCLRREFYNLAHFLSFLLNSDNDTQISGFRKGVRSSDKFSVFSLSYFPIFAIFLLFANWMTTIVTELNQRLILKKPNTSSSQNWIFTFSIYQISG